MIKSSIFGIVLFVALGMTVFSQTIDRESNWSKETGRADDWYTHFDFRRYTIEDVSTARTRFLEIEGDKTLNEWEGLYYNEQMLGRGELMWSVKSGFVKAYTYHTLASLDYGKINRHNLRIVLKSEKRTRTEGLCLVKFGSTHFLVPVESLRSFAEDAAGLSITPKSAEDEENLDYWVKSSDMDSPVFGLPVFPDEFKKLVRQPIAIVAERFSIPMLQKEVSADGAVSWEEKRYIVTLSGGRNKGIRKGMSFYIDDLEERVDVISVGRTRATALLLRSFESNQEICFKYVKAPSGAYDQVRFECRPTKPGLPARTLSETFFP